MLGDDFLLHTCALHIDVSHHAAPNEIQEGVPPFGDSLDVCLRKSTWTRENPPDIGTHMSIKIVSI